MRLSRKLLTIAIIPIVFTGIRAAAPADSGSGKRTAAPVSSGAGTDWRFQPGDALLISAKPDTGFPNGLYPVDGNGYVDLPLIGPVKIVEMDQTAVETLLHDKYVNLLRFSSILARRVIPLSFTGGFQRPGMYWVDPRWTLWQAVQVTGGLVREDGFKKMKLERGGELVYKNIAFMLDSAVTLTSLGIKPCDNIRANAKPYRDVVDIFTQNVLPTLSITLSLAVTSITLYDMYQRYK